MTTDHDEIRKWAEKRGGAPARVRGTGKGEKASHSSSKEDTKTGMIRIDFPGWSGRESLEPISWEEWFQVFDERRLALVYQDKMADGAPSRFNKLVSRDNL